MQRGRIVADDIDLKTTSITEVENVITGELIAAHSGVDEMPATAKGPAITISQFAGDEPPFNTWPAICRWASSLGYKGIQLPSHDRRFFDLKTAAESAAYCDELVGVVREHGIEITELGTSLFGQLVAVNPAFDAALDVFAPAALRGRPQERQLWAVEQLRLAARASRNLSLTNAISFTGALAWPFFYPWPQRPPGLIEEAFAELARRWRPILDAFDEAGVNVCYELHPGEDVFDARRSSGSLKRSAITIAAGSTTIPRISFCSSSTISPSSTSIMPTSAAFT